MPDDLIAMLRTTNRPRLGRRRDPYVTARTPSVATHAGASACLPVSWAGKGRASVGRCAPGGRTGQPTGLPGPVRWGSRPAPRCT